MNTQVTDDKKYKLKNICVIKIIDLGCTNAQNIS